MQALEDNIFSVNPIYLNYVQDDSFERGECLRCRGMQIIDPMIMRSLMTLLVRCRATIYDEFTESALLDDIDEYIHLLESLPNV